MRTIPSFSAAPTAMALAMALACTASQSLATTVFSDNFEGTLAQWVTQTNVAQGAGGNPGQCVWFRGSSGTLGTLASQKISVNSGTAYYLSVDYSYLGSGGYVKIDEYNGGGQLKATQWIFSDNAGTQTALQYFTGAVGWKKYTQSFTTGAPTQTIVITLIGLGAGATQLPPYFDNVSLGTTPPTVSVSVVRWEEVVN